MKQRWFGFRVEIEMSMLECIGKYRFSGYWLPPLRITWSGSFLFRMSGRPNQLKSGIVYILCIEMHANTFEKRGTQRSNNALSKWRLPISQTKFFFLQTAKFIILLEKYKIKRRQNRFIIVEKVKNQNINLLIESHIPGSWLVLSPDVRAIFA